MPVLNIKNPVNGQTIDCIECDTLTSLRQKFETAQSAQKKFALSSLSDRITFTKHFKDLLVANIDALSKDLTLETGKPFAQAKNEIHAATLRIDFFVENASRILDTADLTPKNSSHQELLQRVPLGTIASISAWNYPYLVSINVLIPALLAANSVIYKPSEFASLTGTNIIKLLHRSGFPEDVVVPAYGGGQVGSDLLSLDVAGVYFTGSLQTGKRVLETVKSQLIPVQLELGGKDGVYVCDDVDLSFAVPSIAEGAFYNCGQSCCSVERIYVHKSIYDDFKSRLLDLVSTYVIGDPMKGETFIGPLTRPQQVEFLESQIDRSIRLGAKVLLGGKRIAGAGSFFEPTIVECDHVDAPIIKEESFGPIVSLTKVNCDEEAITQLNNTSYGLTGGVYTKNKERACAILHRINAGNVYWNCCDRVSPRLPWSGVKNSGLGATLGDDGIRCFTRPKSYHLYQEPRSLGE